MKLKTTDTEKITRKICGTKDCPNKATGIINKKYYCRRCYERVKLPIPKGRHW